MNYLAQELICVQKSECIIDTRESVRQEIDGEQEGLEVVDVREEVEDVSSPTRSLQARRYRFPVAAQGFLDRTLRDDAPHPGLM